MLFSKVVPKIVLWISCLLIAGICAFFGLWPLHFGIFHLGNVVLLLMAAAAAALPVVITHHNMLLCRILLGVYALAVGVVLVFSSLMVYTAYCNQPPAQGNYTLVVLGAKVNGMTPSLQLYYRLQAAGNYLLQNPNATVIVSGGQGDDEEYPEAVVMARFLQNYGVEPERILLEAKSTSTRENLRFSQGLIPPESEGIIIVSSNYHVFRANISAHFLGMKPVYNLSGSTTSGLLPSSWMREIPGIPFTFLEEYWNAKQA